MKLLFVWRQYHQIAGGVERTSIELMNQMCRRGHQVFSISWDQAGAQAYYPMDERIQWLKLDCGDPSKRADWGSRWKRLAKIRAHVKRVEPDIVLAYLDSIFLSTRLSLIGLGIPVVEAERCSAARFERLRSPLGTLLTFQSLRLAKRITVQFESYRDDYPPFLRGRIVSIPNPVFPAARRADPAGRPGAHKILLSVGRLAYQKNHRVLLDAFARVAREAPDWTLVVAGDGPDRRALAERSAELGLQARIRLPGTVRDVGKLYAAAHLFCMSSLWEGFPNALAEALAHGLPAVGFAHCRGVRDLIEDGETGVLAKGPQDAATLAGALGPLMLDAPRRKELGERAARSMARFSPDDLFDRWERFFVETVGVECRASLRL